MTTPSARAIHTRSKLRIDLNPSCNADIQTEDGSLEIAVVHPYQPPREGKPDKATGQANAARLVACWNFCDGIPTSALESTTLAGVREVLAEWVAFYDDMQLRTDPDDPLYHERKRIHGARVQRTRAALATITAQKGVGE